MFVSKKKNSKLKINTCVNQNRYKLNKQSCHGNELLFFGYAAIEEKLIKKIFCLQLQMIYVHVQ